MRTFGRSALALRASIALIGAVCLAAAGSAATPALAGKKRPRVPVATTLYLHGTQPVAELEAFVPVLHEDLLTMDPAPATSEEKSKQITNYAAGPNTRCSGNNLFPAWIGEVSGTVTGEIRFVFTSVGTPGMVDIKVWADVPGGASYCDDGYVEPQAEALGVALPAGEAEVEVVLEGARFPVSRTLLLQVSPSTMDVGGTQRPGSNLFVSRIEYDSKSHASALSFSCLPPSGKPSCTA